MTKDLFQSQKQLPAAHRRRRPSGISMAMREISRTDPSKQPKTKAPNLLSNDDLDHAFKIVVANNLHKRVRAYALAHRIYAGKGYFRHQQEGLYTSSQDALDSTLTLLAQSSAGKTLGTITLFFDSPSGLPSDEIFKNELAPLRDSGRKLVEVTRLAIAPDCPDGRSVLKKLINFIFIFAKRVRKFDDFVIEVNPRHTAFYRRQLLFETLAEPRSCPRVQGAPAALLRVDLSIYSRAVDRGPSQVSGLSKTLYSSFLPKAQEDRVCRALIAQQRPMSRSERAFFGLHNAN